MKLVLCATETEYKTAKEFKLPSDCKLIHCGIGKTFASARLAANLAEMNFNCEQVILVGTCGSFSVKPNTFINPQSIIFGDVYCPDLCQSGDVNQPQAIPFKNAYDRGEKVTLITNDSFIFKDRNDINGNKCYDMETASILLLCHTYNIPLAVFKTVSDNGDLELFEQNCKLATATSMEHLMAYLKAK